MAVKLCQVCKKEFNTFPSVIKSGNGKFCSRSCYYSYKKSNKTGKILECPVCKKSFYADPSHIRKNRKYCSQRCSSTASIGRKIVRTQTWKDNISANHHDISGLKNPNWKGGISKEETKYHNKYWKQFKAFKESVFERDNYKCKNCGSTKNLHAHHIIPRKVLKSAEFIRANGVTLCSSCHKKTPSWGGRNKDLYQYVIEKENKLNIICKYIPHCWQDYDTAGNYFVTDDGVKVFFISEMENQDFMFCVFIHEQIEQYICQKRGITQKMVDDWDLSHLELDNPSSHPDCPYYEAHMFATYIEQEIIKKLGHDWRTYDQSFDKLKW